VTPAAYCGISYDDCHDCHGTGEDPHGNMCLFCDGWGSVEEREENDRLWDDACDDEEDFDDYDDHMCTPVQKEPA
jgi:DnaJ-class molecular chaperone